VLTFAIIIHVMLGLLTASTFVVLDIQKREYDIYVDVYENMLTQEELSRIQENKDILNNLTSTSDIYETILNMYHEENFLYVYLIDVILDLQPSDIVINRFSYRNGVISIQANSLDIREGAAYAERLLSSGYFSDVIYSGISAQGPESGYSYNITLYLGDDIIANTE